MKTADKEKLWDAYRQKKTQETREQLIIEYAQLVKLVAGRLSMYLGHNVEYDDLVSYGIFGLIDAIDKFDLEKNVKFETYASLRIRGAILDQIRKMDWIPRSVRQRQRKIDEAMKQIEMRTGKTASDEELAKQLGLTDEELCSWQTQLKVTNVVSLNEFEENGSEPMIDSAHPVRFSQPEEVVEEAELKEKLAESLELLTEKERRVIELYYYEDMTLKEISKILEVSESRISQLHTKALNKMRKKMGVYMNILLIHHRFCILLVFKCLDVCGTLYRSIIDWCNCHRSAPTPSEYSYKHQQDTKPMVDQQNIQVQVDHREDVLHHQVIHPEENEQLDNHTDAREEGKNKYKKQGSVRKKTNKETKRTGGNPVGGSFDMKI